MQNPVGIGLVGAGAFGEFCLAAFGAMDEVRIAAIADVDYERAARHANKYHAVAYNSLEKILIDPAVEVVALNTPPALHTAQGLSILEAKKHLFCEKPLALTVQDGEKLIEAARSNNVLLTVDYVMRYNPFWQAAAALALSGVLGPLRHMSLMNHAAGLSLPTNHWFWDVQQSGGIWIEHGVHFFDAFAWIAGQKGQVICSQSFRRSDGATDRVEALLRFGDVAAHCYHGFDQSGQTEQTTVYLTFANGYITLREWVPTSLELLTTVNAEQWSKFLPGEVKHETLSTGQILARARALEGKSVVYQRCIQAGMRHLTQAVRNPQATLSVTGEDGLTSLRLAVSCTENNIKGT